MNLGGTTVGATSRQESLGELRVVSTVGANTLWLTTVINSAASNQTLV